MVSNKALVGYLRAELKRMQDQNRRLHARIRQLYVAVERDWGIHLQKGNR